MKIYKMAILRVFVLKRSLIYGVRMRKILFLDDDKSLCFLMQELYEDNKEVNIATVNSFQEFVEMEPGLQDFDVIFLDVNLGHETYSGLDAFAWLQKHNFNKKIVFFTGHAQAYPEVKVAIKKPNVFVLEKPATLAQIEKMIND